MTTCNTLASDWSHKFDVLRTNTACHADSEHWVPKHEAKPETLMCCLCKCSHWRWECGPFDLPHDRVHSKGGLFDLAHDRLDPKGVPLDLPHESRDLPHECFYLKGGGHDLLHEDFEPQGGRGPNELLHVLVVKGE
mmetsp:Transcript_9278/g.28600  ORF Transcript_9278/g.28600 Transcript_9278/m.28600 type:complete len:136 (+) Transcript_9278:3-410(+)